MLDLILRFLVGGLAVVACYILQSVVPWPALAGIFAAFPAVMTVAVSTAGHSGGSERAAGVAHGAVYGMFGGLLCAAVVAALTSAGWKWPAALATGLGVWFAASLFCLRLFRLAKPKLQPTQALHALADRRVCAEQLR